MEPTDLARHREHETEYDHPDRQQFAECRGDRNAGHEQAHGYRETRSPQTITDLVKRQHERSILEDAGPEHRPHGDRACKCVGNHEKSAKKGYIYAEGIYSK
jgi:hypothetical protein